MNRRHFLLSVLTMALAACDRDGDDSIALQGGDLPHWLEQLVIDPAAATALGKAYLADYPDENDPQVLLNAIEQAVAHEHTFDELDRAVRAEYAQGDYVQVKQWILSRTEVRLYALISISKGLH